MRTRSWFLVLSLIVLMAFVPSCRKKKQLDYTVRISHQTKDQNAATKVETIEVPRVGPYVAINEFGSPPKDWAAPYFQNLGEIKANSPFRVVFSIEVNGGKRPETFQIELTDSKQPDVGKQLSSESDVPHNESPTVSELKMLLLAPKSPGQYFLHCRELRAYRLIWSGTVTVTSESLTAGEPSK